MTRLASLAVAPPAIPAPHIEYWQLSPILLVFGVAIAGVLVEAFVPWMKSAGPSTATEPIAAT